MRKIAIILLIIFSLTGLSGCINKENPYPYRGSYKELYTTAIYSIPNAVGYMHHGEGAYNPDIYIWEQDDYGRTIFSYCEDYDNKVFCLIVSQTYDETNVYFYPDVNYELTLIDSEYVYEGRNDDYLKNKTKDFYLENRDTLKEENDWDKPLNKSKCVAYSITDHKVIDSTISKLDEKTSNGILNDYTKTLNFINPDPDPYEYSKILQVDAEGKVLYEIHGDHVHYDRLKWNKWDPEGKDFTYYDMILWVITDKEGNYDKETGVMVMYSKANEIDNTFVYKSTDILDFKNNNGWKNLYCDK